MKAKGRGHISVRGTTYDQLKRIAKERGTTMSHLVEGLLKPALDECLGPERNEHGDPQAVDSTPGEG